MLTAGDVNTMSLSWENIRRKSGGKERKELPILTEKKRRKRAENLVRPRMASQPPVSTTYRKSRDRKTAHNRLPSSLRLSLFVVGLCLVADTLHSTATEGFDLFRVEMLLLDLFPSST